MIGEGDHSILVKAGSNSEEFRKRQEEKMSKLVDGSSKKEKVKARILRLLRKN